MSLNAMSASICAALSLGVASAAVVYDESVDGDLREVISPSSTTDLGLLAAGTNTVLGSLDAGQQGSSSDGPDEFDNFLFSVDVPFSIDFSASGNVFVQLRSPNAGGFFVNSLGNRGPGSDVFGDLGVLAVGQYALSLIPGGNGGAYSWAVDINVAEGDPIPLPAAGFLFAGVAAAWAGRFIKR